MLGGSWGAGVGGHRLGKNHRCVIPALAGIQALIRLWIKLGFTIVRTFRLSVLPFCTWRCRCVCGVAEAVSGAAIDRQTQRSSV